MAKVAGFLSPDVKVTRRNAPGDLLTTVDLPPTYKGLLEKILHYFDNSIYPTWASSYFHRTRAAKARNLEKSLLPIIKPLWAGLSQANRDLWKSAAAFVKKNGYQLFVKDTSYRMKNGYDYPRSPNTNFQTHGLIMLNPGGSGQVRFQRDDVLLTGPITVSFNYKKIEHSPPAAQSFRLLAQAWYLTEGETRSVSYAWESPTGQVDWTQVSFSFGVLDQLYYHFRIIFYLDDYDSDVSFTDFLVQDKTRSWSVDYIPTTLPETASPPWAKSGDLTQIKSVGKRLHLWEAAGSANSVSWSRTPTFINEVGSTVWVRLKVVQGNEEGKGPDAYNFILTHSDGIYRIDLLFYTNGFVLKIGSAYHVYRLDMSKFRTFRSFIQDNLVRIYIGESEVYREVLSAAGGEEVSFGALGRTDYPTEVWLAHLAYYHGEKRALEDEVFREGFWFQEGKPWVVDNLYRKTGWVFYPSWALPWFFVDYLG